MLVTEASDFFKGMQRKLSERSSSNGGGRASGLGRCPGMAKVAYSGYSTVKGLSYYPLNSEKANHIKSPDMVEFW